MANLYSYSFDGILDYSSGYGGTFPTTASIRGTFTVGYYEGASGGFVQSHEIYVNGSKLNNASLSQYTNLNGISTYYLSAYGLPGNSSGSNYLDLYYNGREPASFVNAEYRASQLDYSVYPVANAGVTYRSQQVAVSSSVVVCFAMGTQILTERGELAVEDLKVGDIAVTASGALRPITWIGHREIAATSGSLAFNQQPVRVRAAAFGDGLPKRDLFLSPGHPVLVGADADNEGGVLVPVMCLINGTTITREPVVRVTYWHVELDAHDLLLAEGLPAESYIDGGDRAFFSEAFDLALHNPDFVAPSWNGRCRPVAVDGVMVEAERARLDAVFARTLNGQCAWDTSGFISFA